MSNNLTPFQVVERLIGPPEAVGPIAGMNEKTSYGWRKSSANRDAGDIPSARTMRSLLAHAAAKGIPLKAEHLIWGAPAAEVEALLHTMHEADAPASAIKAAE